MLQPTMSERLVYCYAASDQRHLAEMEKHLAALRRGELLEGWHAQLLTAGEETNARFQQELNRATLFVPLLSADFLSSDDCYALLQQAMLRHDARTLLVVPVLIRPVDWQDSLLGGLEPLPDPKRPVTSWEDADQAWLAVALGIRRLIEQQRQIRIEAAPIDQIPNPYRGLAAFQQEHEGLFFGREETVRRLWQLYHRLHRHPGLCRLLAIVGPSGSGKSSVARAGLLPMLQRQPIPGPEAPQVALFTPGDRPIERLVCALLPLLGTEARLPASELLTLTRELRSEHQRSAEGLRIVASTLPGIDRAPLLVVVDQFEETYALCKDAAERRQFIALLLYAAESPESRVSVVLTLRSDFLDEVRQHPELSRAIAQSSMLLPELSVAELRRAILAPAAALGRPLGESTADLLLAAVEGRQGALPLLEFALTRIWDGLLAGKEPTQTLEECGGVGGALAAEAQRTYELLTAAQQRIARRCFLGMIQLGEGVRDTRAQGPHSGADGTCRERSRGPRRARAVRRRAHAARHAGMGAERSDRDGREQGSGGHP